MIKRLSALLLLALAGISLSAQEADFRIMSFNMERGDLSVAKGWGWNVRKPAALAMLEFRRPDIMGVQECNSIQRDDVLERMPDYDYIGVAVSGAADDYPVTSANLIFYDRNKFELLDHGEFWYAFEPDSAGAFTWIARKPRNATWGRFRHKATGREFVYVNNHLQNGTDAVINRSMSIIQLLAKMRELNPEGLPMLYTGDLNSKGIEGYYAPLNQEMREAALSCPVTDLGTTLGVYKTKTEGGRIDHIYYSGALEGLAFGVDREDYEGLAFVSDHFPVYADMRFTPEAPEKGQYWFDLKPSEGDCSVKAGTWNLFSTAERDHRGAPSWKSVRGNVADVIASLGTDLLGLQEITDPMARDLPKLLKKTCGKQYRLWMNFSDENPESVGREAVGLLYNTERFSISRQRVSWITSSPYEAQAKAWNDGYWAVLSAVFTDKATGKRFFAITGKMTRGENSVKYEGAVLKKIEKELNPEELPCILMVDMNATPKNQVWISLLNYWTDCYSLVYPFPDTRFSTRVPKNGFYEGNTPQDWSSKFDVIGISRHVEKSVIVTEHTVHREIADLTPVPSDHCPVTATLVFK